MTELPNHDNNLSTPLNIISQLDGIPLPTAVKKNLIDAICSLVTTPLNRLMATTKAKTNQIYADAKASEIFTIRAAEAAARQIENDPELMARAVEHFSGRAFKAQVNREIIVNLAIDDLTANPPQIDTTEEMDIDWLDMFCKVAESKSNEDIQLILSKILSGEIRNPGRFRPRTIQTLAFLDKETAEIFLSFCKIAFSLSSSDSFVPCVICEPFGEPGGNALGCLGLSYTQLTILQDEGLIQQELNAWKLINPIVWRTDFCIGNEKFKYNLATDLSSEGKKVNVINFTKVGLELRSVMQTGFNPVYYEQFFKWLHVTYDLKFQ